MYAIVENNEVKKIITNPKSMIIGDVRYPAKIFQLWSQDELNAIGIYEVITDSSNFKDESYYINTNEEYNFADGQATKIFIPAEMSATMGSIGAIAELFQTGDSNGEIDKEEAD